MKGLHGCSNYLEMMKLKKAIKKRRKHLITSTRIRKKRNFPHLNDEIILVNKEETIEEEIKINLKTTMVELKQED